MNIELIKVIAGINHIKLLEPATKGMDQIMHAQALLELVNIVAKATKIKKLKKYFFLELFSIFLELKLYKMAKLNLTKIQHNSDY